MGLTMDVRLKIAALRKEKGWSRSEFAKKIGVSYTAVKNWYNDKDYMPSLKVIDDICTAFGITHASLFTDIDQDELRTDQIELLELYDRLSPKLRRNILDIIKNLIE